MAPVENTKGPMALTSPPSSTSSANFNPNTISNPHGKEKDLDLELQAAKGAPISDSEGETTVGRQIELEAHNSIQYRTCSWQKVC